MKWRTEPWKRVDGFVALKDEVVNEVRTDLENLEKYLNFKNRFQGLEKVLKIAKIKKILEKTLNFDVTSLTFVESKILASRREVVCRKSLAKSWDRSTSGEGAGVDAKKTDAWAGWCRSTLKKNVRTLCWSMYSIRCRSVVKECWFLFVSWSGPHLL